MLLSSRILDRDISPLRGHKQQDWQALEDRLESFCKSWREDPSVSEEKSRPEDEHATDGEDRFARICLNKLSEAGFIDLLVPKAFGGAYETPSCTAISIARQWLARESGMLDAMFVMQGLASYPIFAAGHQELCTKLYPEIRQGKTICAFALTEPNAGSDLNAIESTLENADDNKLILNGQKCFISNAGLANSYVVFARDESIEGERKGKLSAVWVPGDINGLTVQRDELMAPHPIGRLSFDNIKIPRSHRLGDPGKGMGLALKTLSLFRPTVGAAALGMADRAFEAAVERLRTRNQFGKALATQQGIQFAFSDLITQHLAAQLLVYRAATASDRGEKDPSYPATAKLYATETAQKVIDWSIQCFGGLGVKKGEVPEKLYREIRALRIYEGASEVQKVILGRFLSCGDRA